MEVELCIQQKYFQNAKLSNKIISIFININGNISYEGILEPKLQL